MNLRRAYIKGSVGFLESDRKLSWRNGTHVIRLCAYINLDMCDSVSAARMQASIPSISNGRTFPNKGACRCKYLSVDVCSILCWNIWNFRLVVEPNQFWTPSHSSWPHLTSWFWIVLAMMPQFDPTLVCGVYLSSLTPNGTCRASFIFGCQAPCLQDFSCLSWTFWNFFSLHFPPNQRSKGTRSTA